MDKIEIIDFVLSLELDTEQGVKEAYQEFLKEHETENTY